jgi:protein-L-isoaspartate(D-aspartate) O-methyltransferase
MKDYVKRMEMELSSFWKKPDIIKIMPVIESLIKEGWLKTPKIIEAFRKIKRVDFLSEDIKDLAELNEALPIGYGQTISQPLVVAFMLEQLEPKEGDKILDVGSGSGWTSALLGEIVGDKGKVIAIEIIPELKEFGEKNVAKYNFIEKGIVEFICADGSKGYEKEAPYDGILVSASVQGKIPQAWKEQLKIGGRIVTPIGSSIWVFVKKSEREFEEIEYPGFAFVPLIKKEE